MNNAEFLALLSARGDLANPVTWPETDTRHRPTCRACAVLAARKALGDRRPDEGCGDYVDALLELAEWIAEAK